MFVCVLACSYYTPYSECNFMYGNFIKRKGVLGNPSYIILAVNKKPNLMPTRKTLFFFFSGTDLSFEVFPLFKNFFGDCID